MRTRVRMSNAQKFIGRIGSTSDNFRSNCIFRTDDAPKTCIGEITDMATNATRPAKRQSPSPDDAEPLVSAALWNVIGYHLRVAQEASFQAFKQRVGNADLKPGRYAILCIIAEHPGLTATELSRACGRDKSTLTPALKDLSQRGFVVRERSPSDERRYTINLTGAGKQLLQQLRVHARAHDRELDRIVGPENRAAFIATLRRIAGALADRD
jgi:DNA-binding MarR family transcriptional regulator